MNNLKSFSTFILEGKEGKCGCCGKKTDGKKCECGCHKMPDGSWMEGESHSESYTIDPKAHRKNQRAAKIRTLAKQGATEGERSAAERKTKGPKLMGEAAWQRKEGKNPEGGLNEKGRKSYERENPGSDLKAPQPEGGPRKRSFCARMSGVKGPMKDEKGRPTRKALALRKWKC